MELRLADAEGSGVQIGGGILHLVEYQFAFLHPGEHPAEVGKCGDKGDKVDLSGQRGVGGDRLEFRVGFQPGADLFHYRCGWTVWLREQPAHLLAELLFLLGCSGNCHLQR